MKPGIDYIGVGCGGFVVNDQHEALLLLRGSKTRGDRGMWNEPGGMVEVGERIVDAIKREVKEELGVDVEVGERLWAEEDLKDDGGHWVSMGYVCRIVSGEAVNAEPHKHEEIRWFPIRALPESLSQDAKYSAEAYKRMFLDR